MPEVTTVDPATGQVLATYPAAGVDEVLQVLAGVHAAQPAWAARPVEERAEVEKSATACDFYADRGPRFLAPRPVDTGGAQRSWVAQEPIGVVLAVMPWNFPFWQVLRFAAPTLLAGNTAVLKHSPNVTGCALQIEQVLRDAGLPEDVLRSVVVAEADVPDVSRALIEDDRVAAVSLTGSERAVTDVTLDMPVLAEETFGPVAAVVVVADDDEAVRIANATRYGLGASVWSADPEHALAVGRRITSGALFVNAVVASDPRLPFGGTKRSGYGRELGEADALEFTNARTYVVGGGVPAGPATE